ncbi:MAG TPA: bifunctional [glutamate--ammonia ligase]-adenylyl-L-tyrosine phosphorylase/[glutamate--ammonia-ligase] adenylyltransferase [Gammaproteobacteria bacterium]|nr:bifunctional [glutamate--ammonia ligase]-adenylyl-L-tyrosine phosphorylase/[glutamate--ammonia-ligase] adenylyltransferase [Gammaproteobacteria bacterium]
MAATLPRVWAASEYVADSCLRDPSIVEFLATGLREARTPGDWQRVIEAETASGADAAAFRRRLRRLRQREMCRIAWRDLAGLATLDDTLEALSGFADACVRAALLRAESELGPRFGRPRGPGGELQELTVLAMGKLGGRELNFSSDIDLVFVHPGPGRTDGARSLASEEYFLRLCQRLIQSLDDVTEDGFVFRVDTRLRPFGASGPLAMSFGAFESYLQQHGRDWERYAYVKARPVTGDDEEGPLFRSILRPFVYRRYLDFGVFQSLRRMKELISRETSRRDLRDDIKSGSGGIREIEFITQTFQLIRGGREPELRARNLLAALPLLERHGLLPGRVAAELASAYRCLRTIENRLQAMHDRQTHALPDTAAERARLAFAMGFADWDGLAATLDRHRACVAAHFASTVFGPPDAARGAGPDDGLVGVWDGSANAADADAALAAVGIREAQGVRAALERLRAGSAWRRMDETARERLDVLIPNLLRAVGRLGDQVNAMQRLLQIVESVGRRSAYLALLNENPAALERLAALCAGSSLLARHVAAHPLLLDELLDPRLFEAPPTREQFAADLDARLSRAGGEDLEQRIEALARFQRAAIFRVAVADLSETLPIMKISDRLTDIAELILERALGLAWDELAARHGRPGCTSGGEPREVGFAIIGYGKLGGLELGYGSDLDLVFVHDSSGEGARTDGPKPLDNAMFFARLGRRIIHLLSTPTASGALYAVDMRLRPSGNAGLLVTSLDSFRRYQQERAWTWEHQALSRARAVAGAPAVRAAFEDSRREILTGHVDRRRLAHRVSRMRERMRRQLSRGGSGGFDIKQDSGGLADIEFLVQYWVLRGAHADPALVEHSDNVRQLEALARAGCIGQRTAARLTATWLAYRRRLHRLALDDAADIVPETEFRTERAHVQRVWAAALGV